jgi:hypothetical protein
VVWGVMDLDLVGQALGLSGLEDFVQRARLVVLSIVRAARAMRTRRREIVADVGQRIERDDIVAGHLEKRESIQRASHPGL